MDTTYICTLPAEKQDAIRKALENAGFSSEDIEMAINSRVCDVEVIR